MRCAAAGHADHLERDERAVDRLLVPRRGGSGLPRAGRCSAGQAQQDAAGEERGEAHATQPQRPADARV
jgi:hypothetical protein